MTNNKIDLVYMWVDGSDPMWLANKSQYDANLDLSNKESFSKCRYFDNQELRFSLRSIEKYASWINHIYIITDNQKPSWLDDSSDKITIVDHKEIFPNEILPCFNSTALEWGIPHIPNLSEHFIYMNDDMMFCDYVKPSDFFTSEGLPIVRLRKRSLLYYRYKSHSNYAQIVFRSIRKIQEGFRTVFAMTPHHSTDAYLKSTYLECEKYYSDEVEDTLKNRFRNENDIHRSIVGLYAIVTGKASLKWVHKFNRTTGFYNKLIARITGNYTYDSMHISNTIKDYKKVLKKNKPKMICLNDNHKSTDEDRVRVYSFLSDYFSEKSIFEKSNSE